MLQPSSLAAAFLAATTARARPAADGHPKTIPAPGGEVLTPFAGFRLWLR